MNEPRSGIHHQHAAVGVFHYIGGMHVGILGGEEISIQSFEGSPIAGHHMPLNTMRIKLRSEQVPLKFLTIAAASISEQSRRCNASKLGHHRH